MNPIIIIADINTDNEENYFINDLSDLENFINTVAKIDNREFTIEKQEI